MVETEVKVNELAEAYVAELIGLLFGGVAALDADTVRENIELASETGMSKADRSVRMELANFLIKNFSVIYLGLIVNADFRASFKDAVSIEMDLMDKSEKYVENIRKELADGPVKPSKGNYVINLSNFDVKTAKKISGMFEDSLKKILPYEAEFDSLQADLTMDDTIEIGFCMSNFMYLIKAFDKNPSFAHYVKSVVKSVKQNLEIE